LQPAAPRIQDLNDEYQERRRRIREALDKRRIDDPNVYSDLWRWHGRWRDGSLPRSCRFAIRALIRRIRSGRSQWHTTGEISHKRGDTLVGTLRKIYGPDFAPGVRSDTRLDTLRRRAGGESLSKLLKKT
jgi:hypothetical protein